MEEKIENAILLYGYYTFLYLLEKLEKDSKYDECGVILSILNRLNERFSFDIETRPIAKTIEDYREEFWKLGFSGDIATKNMPEYVNSLEKYLWPE